MKILQTAKEGAHENYCSDLVRQLLPILLLIMLLAVFHISTARAAGVTLLLAVLSALVVYKADIQLVLFESLKGVWSTATILYIIFPALLLYELIAASGAIDVMNDTMRQLSPHELFRILTVGWVFVGFLQGITGLLAFRRHMRPHAGGAGRPSYHGGSSSPCWAKPGATPSARWLWPGTCWCRSPASPARSCI